MDDEWLERVFFRLLSFYELRDGRFVVGVNKVRYILSSSFKVAGVSEQNEILRELSSRGFVRYYKRRYIEFLRGGLS